MVWYGMLCYAILCYDMVWKVWYAMRFQCYAMRCYATVYVVKDKHSATVHDLSFLVELRTTTINPCSFHPLSNYWYTIPTGPSLPFKC